MPYDPPNRQALLKWVNKLTEGNPNPLALCDDYAKCGNRKPKFSEDDEDLVEQFLGRYLVPSKPSIRGLRAAMADERPARNDERSKQGKAPLELPSYLAVLVDAAEIKAKARGPEHGGLTKTRVYKTLGVNDGVVRSLIREKFPRAAEGAQCPRHRARVRSRQVRDTDL